MRTALETMLVMQYRMNTRVHEDWIEQDFEWYRAVWIECGELVDHAGYKWWKKQEPDLEQVRLEVVDIWHFGLSALFTPEASIDALAARIEEEFQRADGQSDSERPSDIRVAAEALARDCLDSHCFSVALFADLMSTADLGFDQLYRRYVGKNVLNFFRQDHGYKDGTYIKEWGGAEDNVHLVEVLDSLTGDDVDLPDKVYAALAARYPG